jgi:Fe-S-cluster-containing dehydrogenase component/formate-dependent nitrite reductase membrane component NrfD
MTNYAFAIDNRKCIGCHACSTACKAENEVPLGVNRTWVKYVETGSYPDVTRHFQVTRCNHCANPPCVRICPVTAMYQRLDGIVEFDPAICIGCKACMQACPYDAIYIDPDTCSAAKCHFCAHRIELNLEPACVVVCPEHAILAGDLDDPDSEISQALARNKVTVRKPEQGTAPKLFYIHGNELALHPTAARTPETYLWADVIPLHAAPAAGSARLDSTAVTSAISTSFSGTPIRLPQRQGYSSEGPIQIGSSQIGSGQNRSGRIAEQMVQVSYNAQHKIPWHWPVPAYLVTKGIGSGLFLLLGLGLGLNLFQFDAASALLTGLLSLLFIGITTGLLIYDLEHPQRFLYILLRPQWRSWLTRGAFILLGFSLLAGLWWLLEGIVWLRSGSGLVSWLRLSLLWGGSVLAVGSAVYTAYLFGQAEGRDLWQSTLLPFHLVVQALMVGSGVLLLANLFWALPGDWLSVVRITFLAALLVDLFVTLVGEFSMPHASEIAVKAAHEISHGRYRRRFWQGGILLGHVFPLFLALTGWQPALALAGICAALGLYFYEYAFVMAPQEISNS